MDKDISFSGMATVPSDYNCPDGQLHISHNAILDDGALRPVLPPKKVFELRDGETLIYIHSTNVCDNYIITKEQDGKRGLYWFTKTDILTTTPSNAQLLLAADEVLSIQAVGNTLVLALPDSLCYILWRDGAYIPLGERPPFVEIEFCTHHAGSTGSDVDQSVELEIRAYYSPFRTPGPDDVVDGGRGRRIDREYLAELTNYAYGVLNPSLNRNAKAGYFNFPFFVRYAFRLYDGSYIYHSAPILMWHNILPPVIRYDDSYEYEDYTNDEKVQDVNGKTIKCVLRYNQYEGYRLYYRIISDECLELLQLWSDIVVGIDVFASAPIYTYDAGADAKFPFTISCESYFAGHLWGPQYIGQADLPCNNIDDTTVGNEAYVVGGTVYRRFGRPISIRESNKYWPSEEAGEPSWLKQLFIVNIPPAEDFFSKIKDVSSFYKIASFAIDEIVHSDTFAPLELENKDLTAIETRPTLPDDYQSQHHIAAKHLYAFNSRLNMCGIKIAPPTPFSLRSMAQAVFHENEKGEPLLEDADGNLDTSLIVSTYSLFKVTKIVVWSKLEGSKCVSVREIDGDNETYYHLHEYFPRWLYYPDSTAYKMCIFAYREENGSQVNRVYSIPLKPHAFLNGAYFLHEGYELKWAPKELSDEEAKKAANPDEPFYVTLPSKVYTSYTNNPFVFPPTGVNTIGSTDVLALTSAAKALSQGQFGQFPLYAFTNEGIWALETKSDGGYIAKQPISRDVCINTNSITQIDAAVLFASTRGIMMVSGSEVQCLSDIINNKTKTDFSTFKGMGKVIKMADVATYSIIELFADFLRNCRMLYDYVNQRVIVYAVSDDGLPWSYAYVLSLRSNTWATITSDITYAVNAYPDALAVNADGAVLNFSAHDTANFPKALLITRPISLDGPDVLKTVNTIIARGVFDRKHIKLVLYGSRDLAHWHLITSSVDATLRGFSGTPYKHFRLVLLADLAEGESVSGASFAFNARYVNQLR
ncbi:MAG: hypothetical protein ACI30K_05010 [Muribaculaceae bacterium]